MSLSVVFFIFILIMFFRGSWIYDLFSFIKFRKFLLIISSNISCGSLPTFGTPSKNILDRLLLSHLLLALAFFLFFSPFVSVCIISVDLSTGSLFFSIMFILLMSLTKDFFIYIFFISSVCICFLKNSLHLLKFHTRFINITIIVSDNFSIWSISRSDFGDCFISCFCVCFIILDLMSVVREW